MTGAAHTTVETRKLFASIVAADHAWRLTPRDAVGVDLLREVSAQRTNRLRALTL
jgi:hypothetical protein